MHAHFLGDLPVEDGCVRVDEVGRLHPKQPASLSTQSVLDDLFEKFCQVCAHFFVLKSCEFVVDAVTSCVHPVAVLSVPQLFHLLHSEGEPKRSVWQSAVNTMAFFVYDRSGHPSLGRSLSLDPRSVVECLRALSGSPSAESLLVSILCNSLYAQRNAADGSPELELVTVERIGGVRYQGSFFFSLFLLSLSPPWLEEPLLVGPMSRWFGPLKTLSCHDPLMQHHCPVIWAGAMS